MKPKLVQTRIPEDHYWRLVRKAQAENRSIANYLAILIAEHVRPVTGRAGAK